jgi:hypothetical protein
MNKTPQEMAYYIIQQARARNNHVLFGDDIKIFERILLFIDDSLSNKESDENKDQLKDLIEKVIYRHNHKLRRDDIKQLRVLKEIISSL